MVAGGVAGVAAGVVEFDPAEAGVAAPSGMTAIMAARAISMARKECVILFSTGMVRRNDGLGRECETSVLQNEEFFPKSCRKNLGRGRSIVETSAATVETRVQISELAAFPLRESIPISRAQ